VTDNGVFAHRAKVELRTQVLAELGGPASVLDVFCGETGVMHRDVWRNAASYVGCDKEWRGLSDERVRFVGDSLLMLRAIDLQPFNVFDCDAYGSPWTALQIIANRRKWKAGERGAVVFTDGSDGKLKFGAHRGIAALLGTNASHKTLRTSLQDAALTVWLRKANVKPLKVRRARGFSGKVGSMKMTYCAVLLEGIG
jgi:hypothetical protein